MSFRWRSNTPVPLQIGGGGIRPYLYVVLTLFATWNITDGTAEAVHESSFSQQCETRTPRPTPTALQTEFEQKLHPFKQCVNAIDDKAPCNIFVGKALETLFSLSDFKNGTEYLLANAIAERLSNGMAGWTKLGEASTQAVLTSAQDWANNRAAVVAVKPATNMGHVALILPGTIERYNLPNHTWATLQAPNSASFFMNDPQRVFVGCPLSAVWQAPANVSIYYKVPPNRLPPPGPPVPIKIIR